MTTEEILVKAAGLVMTERWVQNPFDNEGKRCGDGFLHLCLVNAVRHAGAYDWDVYQPALNAIGQELEIVGLSSSCLAGKIGCWNDEIGRTREEVATVLLNSKRQVEVV